MNHTKKIGITGGIGAGKSFICSIISTLGHPIFYSDQEANKITQSNPGVIKSIIRVFGEKAYLPTGLNRAFIAEQIFNDSELLKKMNAIVHPAVADAFTDFVDSQKSELIFNEAAILFETGSYKKYDATVLVTAPIEIRIQRVIERDGTNEAAVRSRMSKQWSDDKKRELADFIIVNDGKEMILPQVLSLIEKLKK